MTTLNINGKRVNVDDSFLSLSPEQQNATVDEIAALMGGSAPIALKGSPGQATGPSGMSANLEDQNGQPIAPPQPVAYKPGIETAIGATVNGLVNSVPFLQGATDQLMARGGQLFGQDYDKTMADLKAKRDAYAQASPVARVSGDVAGLVGGTGALGASVRGAEALGLVGKFGQQIVNSALSTAGLSGLSSMSSGNSGAEVLGDMATGGVAGLLTPAAGAVLKAGGKAIGDNIVRPVATMLNRDNEAIGRVGRAVAQDRGVGGVMTQADEAVAANANAPVLNADRFGAATRTLARTAANVSPEAEGVLKGAVEDRFLTQGARAKGFVNRLMNGATDDLALQDSLRSAAQASNKIAYDAARANPNSSAIWNEPIKELMQSPTFRAAISEAETLGADRAAVAGVKAVRNPFVFAADGTATPRVFKDGSRALPSLDFWDQVKRNLDVLIEQAKPGVAGGGSRTKFNDLTALKRKLVGALDSAVPEYQGARQGAAKFFGAEDAIDAGRKAFTMTRSVPELRRAHFAMKPAEKEAASVGYVSEMIDAIDASKDRVNVINSLFGSESARARNELFLGPQRAKQLEAYVKVEQTLHMLKEAVSGNSSTAKQLIAAGVLGGAGGLMTGDFGNVGSMAALAVLGRRGMQMIGKKVDDQVMKKVAEMLVSGDPKMVERAIQNASLSKAHMEALEAYMQALSVGARGATIAAVAN